MKTNVTEKTCADLVHSAWAGRRADLEQYADSGRAGVYEEGNDELPPFNEYGLSLDVVEAHTFEDQHQDYGRYQFSWGGPSEEIRFYCDRIEFWYMDWFDGAKVDISTDDVAIWLADHFVDFVPGWPARD